MKAHHTSSSEQGSTTPELRRQAIELLRQNIGFDRADRWVEYAVHHNFVRVQASPVSRCPDCDGAAVGTLGQYVYYSTLIRLRVCGACHLIWSDARLDPETVRGHFDRAYKDREYFLRPRQAIFAQLAREVARAAPHGGRVLDVGGAQGDLMALVRRHRPDLDCTVHDLSAEATDYANAHFGFPVLQGGLEVFDRGVDPFDVVVLSDVLYYEPDLAGFWARLPGLLRSPGTAILRVPNKLLAIRVAAAIDRLGLRRPADLRDSVRFFNPEHIYILSRTYLTRRLVRAGFDRVRVLPSPPLLPASPLRRAAARTLHQLARAAHALTGGRLVATPGMVLVATRP